MAEATSKSAPTKTASETNPAPAAEALVQDLRSLRRLASQLHRRASTADSHMVRVIMGKRELLLDSIRARVSRKPDDSETVEDGSFADALELSAQEKEVIAETVHEIRKLDTEAQRILKGRSDKLGAEIRRLKAGKKSRECYRKWT